MKLDIIRRALREDIGSGDVTTNALFSKSKVINAVIICKQAAVISGVGIAKKVFKSLDVTLQFKARVKDGDFIKANKKVIHLRGKARAILTAERTALNFLSHLSGIATSTHEHVARVKSFNVKIIDTRKTIPGMRTLEKAAVRCGGGSNHRMGLHSMVLIKDNHKNAFGRKVNIKTLIKSAKKRHGKAKKIEIEVESLREFRQALEARPDIIMLDNMSIENMQKAVRLRNGPNPKLEASGNINLKNIRKIAKTGVDLISIGSIIHSAKAVDFSLEVVG
ncbi:carboxylating nicotinate-nucleotide diphosphorylase [Candidatus Omnitrophota bacterium]